MDRVPNVWVTPMGGNSGRGGSRRGGGSARREDEIQAIGASSWGDSEGVGNRGRNNGNCLHGRGGGYGQSLFVRGGALAERQPLFTPG